MEALTEREALVGIAMCAAYADGAMGADEDDRLTEHLHSCRALQGLDDAALQDAMQKADRIRRQEGEDALLARAAAALRPELRPTAFTLGADLVLADEEVAREERGFVERLRRTLGVEPALAQRIVDVLLIRARA